MSRQSEIPSLPVPPLPYAVLSKKVYRKFYVCAEYATFEVLRYLSSGSGGWLSVPVIKSICLTYGAKYGTVQGHLKKCIGRGWVAHENNGYRFISEQYLHYGMDKTKGSRLGPDAVKIPAEKLLSFFGKSITEFRSWLTVNGDIKGYVDLQDRTISGMLAMKFKLESGQQITVDSKEWRRLAGQESGPVALTIELLEKRLEHYTNRRVQFDGAPFSTNLEEANSRTWRQISYKNSNKYDESSDGKKVIRRKKKLKSHPDNALCSVNIGTPIGISREGEQLPTSTWNNTTRIWSPEAFDIHANNFVKFADGNFPSGKHQDLDSMYRTTLKEANFSLSTLSEETGRSKATLSRAIHNKGRGHDNLLWHDTFMVLGDYGPKKDREANTSNVNEINEALKGKRKGLRGGCCARRISKKHLLEQEAKGATVKYYNIHGSIDDLIKYGTVLTALAFQRAYFFVDEVLPPVLLRNNAKNGSNEASEADFSSDCSSSTPISLETFFRKGNSCTNVPKNEVISDYSDLTPLPF